jgi:Tfp pilus assembly protein PilN
MINLLPYESKKQIRAARSNVSLVRYLILIGVSMVFLAGFSATIYVVLVQTKASAENTTTTNESKESSYSAAEAEATTFRANLATTKTVLDQSVSYSNVMIAIAGALPAGVIIDSLTLSPATIGVPIALEAHAQNNDEALLLKKNFSESPLFSNVSIQSLSSDGDTDSNYPVAITLSVTINKVAAS